MNFSPLLKNTKSSNIGKFLYQFLFIFLIFSSYLHAANVTLTWNPNNESDLAGYKIYKRVLPSTDYGLPIFSGLPPDPSAPQLIVTNLTEGASYGFIATALDSSGNESSPSTEKQTTVSALENSVTSIIEGPASLKTTEDPNISTPEQLTVADSKKKNTTTTQTVSVESNATGVATSNGGGSTTVTNSFPPTIASPAPGSTLTTTSVTFSGAHTSQDLQHLLRVGTTSGGSDLYSQSLGTGHSTTVSGLPTRGPVYVSYWTRNSTGWFANRVTFTMNVGDNSDVSFPKNWTDQR